MSHGNSTLAASQYRRVMIVINHLILSVLLLNLFASAEFQNESTVDLNSASYSVFSVVYNNSVDECEYKSNSTICVRKCCAVNYTLKYQVCVFDNVTTEFKVPLYKDDNATEESSPPNLHFLPGMTNCGQKYTKFKPKFSSSHIFYVKNDGRLWFKSYNVSYDQYCIEHFENGGMSAYVCVPDEITVVTRLDIVGMLISLPFLFVTFVVYALLPERNLHGTCLMCYVFTLFGVYLMYCIMHFDRFALRHSFTLCRTLLLTTLYLFMASLCWMNIMAFDIWSTFSGWRGFVKEQTQWMRFGLYSLYAWTLPLIQICIIIVLSYTLSPDAWYTPGVRGGDCSIKEGVPQLLYFYGPMAILIIINIILFAITAYKIKKVQKETEILRGGKGKTHGNEDYDNKRFKLYIKLLFAMGINWSMEIIPWALEWKFKYIPEAVWYFSEFCNAAFGVFIFFIFVFKKKIWKLLKKRYYMITSKKQTD